MKILIDGDACPVVKITEEVARAFSIPVIIFIDTNHVMKSDYSEVIVIGAGADAVDMALINRCSSGDIVVTQDYGLAAMALGKNATVLHQDGWLYTDENIDRLLDMRYIGKKIRRAGGRTKGPKKRNHECDEIFREKLRSLLAEARI